MANKKGIIKKVILGTIVIIVLFILIIIINLIMFEKNASVVSKGEPIEESNEIRPALLVVDVQEATTGKVSLNEHYIEKSNGLITNINSVTEEFRKQNLPVIYIRSEITNPLINLLNNSYAKGSPGSKFDHRLKVISNLEVVKSRNDAFFNTDLDEILRDRKINELYIVGLDAAHCINITIDAAQNRNYHINLIKEGILSESTEIKDSMLIQFQQRNVKVLNLENLQPTLN